MTEKNYFERKKYFNLIEPFINNSLVKVITGLQGAGKRSFVYGVMDYIKSNYPKGQIILVDQKLEGSPGITTHHELLEYVKSQTDSKKERTFLFVDKIQNIKNFELVLGNLLEIGGYEIYLTGSNTAFLSSLSSILAGRYMNFQMNCLSYQEFLVFHGLENDEGSLLKYIKYGGLPFLKHLELENFSYEYISCIYDSIILKEIVSRFQVRNVSLLEDLNKYMANHLGSLVSAKKISDFLKSQNLNYSPRVIINYLTYLTSSFLIHKVRRANLQDRKIYEVNEKYYFEDLGLRHSIVRYKDTDIEKVLENLIYKHLIYCGYDVFVGQLGKKEIDFWCEKMGKSIYVQAVHLIPDEKTHQREFGSLLEIKDNYPKYVVSMDPSAGESYEGIHHMHILDFLTSDV